MAAAEHLVIPVEGITCSRGYFAARRIRQWPDSQSVLGFVLLSRIVDVAEMNHDVGRFLPDLVRHSLRRVVVSAPIRHQRDGNFIRKGPQEVRKLLVLNKACLALE